ncbi:MAG TPA: hypothetical protein VG295_14055 [Solirubrobacteraceae bacterium]|jgi:hypothetical protein|nr:hypothetical protein [Solirubrobacteraceae bacterium]
MKYKLLGFAVWRGARWYLRRRYSGKSRKLFAAGVVAAVAVGAAVAQRRASGANS